MAETLCDRVVLCYKKGQTAAIYTIERTNINQMDGSPPDGGVRILHNAGIRFPIEGPQVVDVKSRVPLSSCRVCLCIIFDSCLPEPFVPPQGIERGL